MDYFAGLDISMDETQICLVDREGEVVYEGQSASTAGAIADKLSEAPSCHRIVFETGRMAPILFHGLSQLGLPAVCVESRQAYQALQAARDPQDRPQRQSQRRGRGSLCRHARPDRGAGCRDDGGRGDRRRYEAHDKAACRRLMTIPGVGQLTALAFVAAIDDPSRIRRSRDVGAYLGLVPRRYQSGEVDYVGGISKCGDRQVRTLLYEIFVPGEIRPGMSQDEVRFYCLEIPMAM
jgi:hypothetical protein